MRRVEVLLGCAVASAREDPARAGHRVDGTADLDDYRVLRVKRRPGCSVANGCLGEALKLKDFELSIIAFEQPGFEWQKLLTISDQFRDRLVD